MRDPTAARVFADDPPFVPRAGGPDRHADQPLTCDMTEWCDLVFVMAQYPAPALRRMCRVMLPGRRVEILVIGEENDAMDLVFIALLQRRVAPHLVPR